MTSHCTAQKGEAHQALADPFDLLDLLPLIVARYFGLTNTGKLYGPLYGGFIIGGGLSVLILVILAKAVGLRAAFFLNSTVLVIAGTGLLAALMLAERMMRADNGPGERVSGS